MDLSQSDREPTPDPVAAAASSIEGVVIVEATPLSSTPNALSSTVADVHQEAESPSPGDPGAESMERVESTPEVPPAAVAEVAPPAEQETPQSVQRASHASSANTAYSFLGSGRKDRSKHESHGHRKARGRGCPPETSRLAEIMYYKRASVLQNPLLPPCPCRPAPRGVPPLPGRCLSIASGPDRSRLLEEKRHFQEYKPQSWPASDFHPNPAVSRPQTARRNLRGRAAPHAARGNPEMGWREREERLKDFRDHKLAEEIGYETLVGNLLYIEIPRGRDINRSWENFLSHDVMEWGFPYYKGSRDRPRFRQREPYLAHQLKEKMWKYPKTRIFHSVAED